jgi:hypothetical protein
MRKPKTEREAAELWITRDFSAIPTSFVARAFKDNPEDLELLAGELDEWLPIWGTMFHPDDPFDEDWIRMNAEQVAEECGLIVYDAEDIGILLGIDGGGYDFYEVHWIPLYRLRGLRWHRK